MSNDEFDVLRQAAKSLRDSGQPSEAELRRVRARVLSTVNTKRKPSRFWTIALPIAAVFVGTSVWAEATGRIPEVGGGKSLLVKAAEPLAKSQQLLQNYTSHRVSETQPNPDTKAESVATAQSATGTSSPSPSVLVVPSNTPVSTIVAREPVVKPIPTALADTSDTDAGSADLALYKQAHKLHFVDKAPAAALSAWDDYLKAAPTGAFVTDARYNRAICLIKLGRHAEAKLALTPFAEGKVAGGYRSAEAQKLLDALE